MAGKSKQELNRETDPDPVLVSLREELTAQIRENEKLKRQTGDDDRLFNHIQDSIEALEPYRAVPIPRPQLKHAPLEALLCVTDAHSEEVVDAEEMEGLGSYNWATFLSRMETLGRKTVELTGIMRQASQVDQLTILMLGDWFLGQIHPDELVGASMPLPPALARASRQAADLVLKLAAHFKSVRVVGVVGNHGRSTSKPVSKMSADRNWDYALYLIAKEFTRSADNVVWDIPRSLVKVVDVMGWRVAATHGDIAVRTHRVPYFGILDSMRKQQLSRRKTDVDFDYVYMGHWHCDTLLESDIVICPPMVGRQQFGQYRVHAKTVAAQRLDFFSQKYGPTVSWNIRL